LFIFFKTTKYLLFFFGFFLHFVLSRPLPDGVAGVKKGHRAASRKWWRFPSFLVVLHVAQCAFWAFLTVVVDHESAIARFA
jgi:hypothetical protein